MVTGVVKMLKAWMKIVKERSARIANQDYSAQVNDSNFIALYVSTMLAWQIQDHRQDRSIMPVQNDTSLHSTNKNKKKKKFNVTKLLRRAVGVWDQ